MTGDPFGNLRDWSATLDELRRRAESGTVDEAQAGLVRLIRYRCNWRVREEAIRAARLLSNPDAPLLRGLLDLALDSRSYPELRTLAVEALGELIARSALAAVDELNPETILEILERLLALPEDPAFHAAVERTVREIETHAEPIPA